MESSSTDPRPVPQSSPIYGLKGEAKQLCAEARAQGQKLSHAAALERVAHRRGFRDWNALSAHIEQGEGIEASVPMTFLWRRLDEPLPELPIRVIAPSEMRRHSNISELMRWARQLDFIANKVAEADRAEMMAIVGERTPYVIEQSPSRWPDGLFHLCDRGYEVFKGIAFSADQVRALGLPAWNDAYGQHDGKYSFTVVGDERRRTRNEEMLKRMARLLASMAIEADKAGAPSGIAPGALA